MKRKSVRIKDQSTPAQGFWGKAGEILRQMWQGIRAFVRKIGKELKKAWHGFLRSFVRWSDPRLEPYREKKWSDLEREAEKAKIVVQEQTYNVAAPSTREELFALIRETPITVLSGEERKAMSAILSLPEVQVAEIMTRGSKIVFVNKDEVLGPLVLDKLYRSGFTFFPVIDGREHIIGTLHTALLNSLDVKETKSAREVMEPRVYYLRGDYNLEQALKAFLRTGSQIMLVVDQYEKLLGMLTFAQLMDYLFSEKFVNEDFDRDDDRLAVAKRKTKK